MDPYKLEYFTLNPSVTLGGGHFGIVRRGFCNVIPDRLGTFYQVFPDKFVASKVLKLTTDTDK